MSAAVSFVLGFVAGSLVLYGIGLRHILKLPRVSPSVELDFLKMERDLEAMQAAADAAINAYRTKSRDSNRWGAN